MQEYNINRDAYLPIVTSLGCVPENQYCFNDGLKLQHFPFLGKTTILYRFKMNETLTTLPTIGFNVETLSPIKGLTLTVWDMGGQDRMRPLWRMYLRGTDGK